MNNKTVVTIYEKRTCIMICVNGLQVHACETIGDAWNHIEWMYRVTKESFLVGENEIPVEEWLDHMYAIGYLDG